MLIVQVFQGLGNQLFHYAYARAQSLRMKVPFKLDITYYDLHEHQERYGVKFTRSYGLDRFNVLENIATEHEINSLKNEPTTLWGRLMRRIRRKCLPYYRQSVVKEDWTIFDWNLLKVGGDTWIHGYYTSEVFFKDYRDIILKEFSLKNEPSDENKVMINRMQASNSICLSIRRGDFIKNPLHACCGEAYYLEAANRIVELINQPNPHFFIFSDDVAWVKNYFKLPFDWEFVEHNKGDFYEDLRLMTHCKHHVIPNSTFSWWGAWLAQYPQKIVVAPKYWLNTSEIDYSMVLPQEWITIEHDINCKFTGD